MTNTGIFVGPDFEGRIARTQLLQASMSLVFWMPPSCLQSQARPILEIRDQGFELELSIRDGVAYLRRNGHVVSGTLQIKEQGWMQGNAFLAAVWSPTELSITVGGDDQRRDHCNTPFTLPPYSLIDWARRQSILPTSQYSTPNSFRDVILNILDGLTDKVASTGMHPAFWDIEYEGRRVAKKTPKRETHSHPTIHGLLFDIALAKNLSVQPEAKLGSGNCDFVVTGALKKGGLVHACIEFKNAHSPDVVNGLTVQLPEYMRRQGTTIGFYGVLWFKGNDLDEPSKNQAEFRAWLLGQKNTHGLNELGLTLVDLTAQPSPSRM